MRTLSPAELKKQLKQSRVDSGLKLYRENRVYKPRQVGDVWTAMVLAEAPLPFDLALLDLKTRVEWSCSCGSEQLCAHFWAFAVRLYKDEKLYNGDLRSVIGKALDPRSHSVQNLSLGKGSMNDLFDEGLFQPSLFDDEHSLRATTWSQSHDAGPDGDFSAPVSDVSGLEGPATTERSGLPGLFGRPELLQKRAAASIIVRRPSLTRPDIYIEPSYVKPARKPTLHHDEQSDPESGLNLVKIIAGQVESSGLPALLLSACAPHLIELFTRDRNLLKGSPNDQRVNFFRLVELRVEAEFTKANHDGRSLYAIKLVCKSVPFQSSEPLRPDTVFSPPDIHSNSQNSPRLKEERVSLQMVSVDHETVYFGNPDSLVICVGDRFLCSFLQKLKQTPALLSGLDLEQIKRSLDGRFAAQPDDLPTDSRAAQPDDPVMAKQSCVDISVEIPSGERFEYIDAEPRPIVRFQASGDRTDIFILFSYQDAETRAYNSTEVLSKNTVDGPTLMYRRNTGLERLMIAALRKMLDFEIAYESGLYAGLLVERNVADMALKMRAADFVTRFGPPLMDAGFELRTEGKTIRARAKLSFRAESDLDWFGFKVGWKPDTSSWTDSPADSVSDYAAAADTETARPMHIGRGLETYGMVTADTEDDSYWVVFDKRDIDKLKLLKELGMDADGVLETSPVNVSLIDSLYDQIENKNENHIVRARELGANLRVAGQVGGEKSIASESLSEPQPQNFTATLRPYQLIGYNWLLYMHRNGLGACLADDMGLGKTVQTIALLQRLKERDELGPSLLIGPVVTMPNWEDELKRFAPGLRIRRHNGQNRPRTIDDILSSPDGLSSLSGERIDLVLVSYNTLRNDLDIFVKYEWTYVILDEAHYIKNASSQVFKAVRVLPAKHRLSLTGTPIENSTMELWSQFSFLNPGLLGGQKKFHSEVASPIEKEGDDQRAYSLRDTIAPFILRRRKQEVLQELPPKEEILYWTEMAPDQARLYEEHRNLYRDQIAGILSEKGIEASGIDIFRFLLRLRQLAIHPGLAVPKDPAYTGASSCKLEALDMLLDESLQENHKMLIFSQFVSALKLISNNLDRDGRSYALLTGATADRRAEVERFRNNEDLRIFLLSLKAGGVGINLTAADYVVLFDPWWNPAAEQQAIDRAHRIGQNRPVLVYKFITRGTIEEKILELQQRKHRLAGSLLASDENLLSGLSEDDVMSLFEV